MGAAEVHDHSCSVCGRRAFYEYIHVIQHTDRTLEEVESEVTRKEHRCEEYPMDVGTRSPLSSDSELLKKYDLIADDRDLMPHERR